MQSYRTSCKSVSTASFFFFFLFSFVVWLGHCSAFYVESDSNGDVFVANTQTIPSAYYYLAWIDVNRFGKGQDNAFSSFTEEEGWVSGLLKPYREDPFRLDPFNAFRLTSIPEDCEAGHECLLVLLAQTPSCDIATLNDCSFSIFPLSKEAALKRYPGQSFFVSLVGSGIDSDSFAFATGVSDDSNAEATVTQKPDIYAIDSNRLFLANSIAKKLQLVDFEDIKTPSEASNLSFSGSPKEVYFLNGRCYLLEEITANNKTRLSVIKTENNQLVLEQALEIDGFFKASRRRNNVIHVITETTGSYAVTEPYLTADSNSVISTYQQSGVMVSAYSIGADGRLSLEASEQIVGSAPVVSISSDYLVVAAADYTTLGYGTGVEVYSLKESSTPLKWAGRVKAPGFIPSERHISVDDNAGLLRLVYGDQSWPRTKGSALAIYDLNKAGLTGDFELKGLLDGLAPGEQLFATVFEGSRVYIVTFENKDPLWVIDISNPSSPKNLGRLEVPGWSEMLFFKDSLLFGIGVDDQSYGADDSQWAQRVSVSLFDVTNPASPLLKDRLTPFAGDASVSYTFSEATTDERALLLDWNAGYAAFPLDAWQSAQGSYLQSLGVDATGFDDLGKVSFPVSVRRAIPVDDSWLLALGEQELFVLDRGTVPHSITGSLELSRNITWLGGHVEGQGRLFAGVSGNSGIYKLFGYDPLNLNLSGLTASFSSSYQQGVYSADKVFFYSTYPDLTGQVCRFSDGKTTAEQKIESFTDGRYMQTEPLIYGDNLFVAESSTYRLYSEAGDSGDSSGNQENIQPALPDSIKSDPYLSILRKYNIDMTKGVTPVAAFTIAGEPVGFNSAGNLVCREYGEKGALRINVLDIADNRAVIRASREMNCNYWDSSIVMDNPGKGENIYLVCAPRVNNQDIIPLAANSGEDGSATTIIPPYQPVDASLMWLDADTLKARDDIPENGFEIKGLSGVIAGMDNLVVVSQRGEWQPCPEGMYCIAGATMLMPYYQPESRIFKLTSQGAVEGKKIEDVYLSNQLVLLKDRIYVARGVDGIEVMSLDE